VPDACVQVKNARCFKHPLQGNLRESKRTMQSGRYSTIQVATQDHSKRDDGEASETAAPQHEAGLDEPPALEDKWFLFVNRQMAFEEVLQQTAEARLTDQGHADNVQDQTGDASGDDIAPRSAHAETVLANMSNSKRSSGDAFDKHAAELSAMIAESRRWLADVEAAEAEADAEGTEEEGSQDEDALEDEESLEDEDQLSLSDAEGDVGAC
jgi:hypothetical protein